MLRWRLILGTLFIAALVGLFFLDALAADKDPQNAGRYLLPLALVVAVAGTIEYVALVATREPLIPRMLLIVCNVLIVVAAKVDGGQWHLWSFAITAAVLILFEVLRYDKDSSQRVTERLALGIFGLTYLGLFMSFIVRLRMTPAGMTPLVMMLVVVKMCDTGAYTVGRLIGKHKMAPKLSPGKTWEGFAGGLIFAVLGGFACADFRFGILSSDNPAPPSVWPFIIFSLVVGTAGVVGDLAESLLKRDFGVKDSSTWMPGFGGVLDLIDSPLLAAPVAWAFWEFGWLVSRAT